MNMGGRVIKVVGPRGALVPTYKSWQAMKQRCSNPGATSYRMYGGRGIAVCEEWMGSFAAFLRDMGKRPPGKTLDRIDNNKGYAPGNCRWASPVTQSTNRSSVRLIEIDGEVDSITGWARKIGATDSCITYRYNKGVRGADLLRPSQVKRKAKP